jgi:prolyl oligopeptidase
MKNKLIISAILLASIACSDKTAMNEEKFIYPETFKDSSIVDDYFGTKVYDVYRWLENDTSAQTKAWVEAQNKITNAFLEQIPYRNQIKKRLEDLWNYEKISAPFKEGNYTYFYKNNGLQNHAVLYRQKNEASAPEIFLDPNTFSKDGTTSMSGIQFTKDGSLAAFQISEGGSDWAKIIVIDSETKKVIGDTLKDIKFSGIAWLKKDGFFYSSYDKPKEGSQLSAKTQFHKLYYHQLGTPQSADILIFGGEKMPRRYIGGSVSEDGTLLFITAANTTYGNELYCMSLSGFNGQTNQIKITTIAGTFDFENDPLDFRNGLIYINTNENAPNRKIVAIPFNKISKENYKDIIPESKFPLGASTAGNYIFANYLKDAVSYIVQYDFTGKQIREIELPGVGSASGFGAKANDTELYYSFTNYITPGSIYKLNIETGKSELYKKPDVKFNPEDYVSEQVFYTSKDGIKVPMIITYKRGINRNGKNPTMLYGYGGFNISLTPRFSVSNIVLLENGGVYAVANLRGGGEYGEAWHKAGTQMQKQNVFDDFIAAAEYLIAQKFTSSDYLAISGGSNGGLLVGACLTQKPNLFKVCFPAVGVLDMLRYNKFTAGAGWAYDYGTAEDSPEMFQYLFNYSPVHNVKKGTCYPAIMVMTADHDDRVVPAHSFKFAAELQAKQNCNKPVMIRIETKAGHGSGKPTAMVIDENADRWAFMFYIMGLSLN